MAKFKLFHEFQKPLVGFTPEAFLDYIETVLPKDREGFEKWLSGIEAEIASLLKEAETTDKQEDETCKVNPEREALQNKLSERTYLKRKIEEALEIIMKGEGKEKNNLTDRDANHMKSGGSKDIRPGYNAQAAVTETGIIVAAEAVTDANDQNQLKPVIEQTESNTQEKVREVAADCGYGSYANYEYLEQRGIDGYVPDSNFQQYKSGEYQKEENRYHYTNFIMMRQVIGMDVRKESG